MKVSFTITYRQDKKIVVIPFRGNTTDDEYIWCMYDSFYTSGVSVSLLAYHVSKWSRPSWFPSVFNSHACPADCNYLISIKYDLQFLANEVSLASYTIKKREYSEKKAISVELKVGRATYDPSFSGTIDYHSSYFAKEQSYTFTAKQSDIERILCRNKEYMKTLAAKEAYTTQPIYTGDLNMRTEIEEVIFENNKNDLEYQQLVQTELKKHETIRAKIIEDRRKQEETEKATQHRREESARINNLNRSFLQLFQSTSFASIMRMQEQLNQGAQIDFSLEENGYTALMLAVDGNDERAVEFLLRNGANPWKKNIYGTKARYLSASGSRIHDLLKNYELIYAVKNNDTIQVMESLRNGANVNFMSHEGYTAIMLAEEQNNTEILTLLREKANTSRYYPQKNASTPFMQNRVPTWNTKTNQLLNNETKDSLRTLSGRGYSFIMHSNLSSQNRILCVEALSGKPSGNPQQDIQTAILFSKARNNAHTLFSQIMDNHGIVESENNLLAIDATDEEGNVIINQIKREVELLAEEEIISCRIS